jgi:hypothetical protein
MNCRSLDQRDFLRTQGLVVDSCGSFHDELTTTRARERYEDE